MIVHTPSAAHRDGEARSKDGQREKSVTGRRRASAPAILTFGGINEVLHTQRIADTIAHLGYPAFLPEPSRDVEAPRGHGDSLAGGSTLEGVGLRGRVLPTLTGAIVSHTVVGDGPAHLAPPMVVLALLATSWALRPADRKLGATSDAEPSFTGESTVGRAPA